MSKLTRQEVLLILQSSFAVVNNWGGRQYSYIPNKEREEETDTVTLFDQTTSSTLHFSLSNATLVNDGDSFLVLYEVSTQLPFRFLVLQKLDLEWFSLHGRPGQDNS